jgi:hypothetical protein
LPRRQSSEKAAEADVNGDVADVSWCGPSCKLPLRHTLACWYCCCRAVWIDHRSASHPPDCAVRVLV